jgi:hypothetical protein
MMDEIVFCESVSLCVNHCLLLDNVLCGTNSLCEHLLLNLGYWVVSVYNFHIVNMC